MDERVVRAAMTCHLTTGVTWPGELHPLSAPGQDPH